MRHIQNLPHNFPMALLQKFDFGLPDAKDDPLLEVCALKIAPIAQFLTDNKSILVGDRGSGKTAVFRLLSDRKIQFTNNDNLNQIHIPIDEELSYKTLKGHISNQIKESTKEDASPHRLVWELFIFSRCLEGLRKQFEGNRRFDKINEEFQEAVGLKNPGKVGLIDLITKTKKTFGVKLENGHMGYVVPNFYASVEPKREADEPIDQSNFLDLPRFKSELNLLLADAKAVAYVLIDKLDEFVSGEEYKTQLSTLQALIQSWRDYQSYPKIKIKLFLRRDLYERLDFSSIGRDKIEPRKVELIWTDEDIRHLIATRIFHNIQSINKGKSLAIYCDERYLTIDRQFLNEIRSLDSIPENERSILDVVKHKFLMMRDYLRQRKRDAYDARTTNVHDMAYTALITTLFPRAANHKTKANKIEQIEISTYFSTHFQFSSKTTTPRIILLFLQYCLEATRHYYLNNPTESIQINEKGEYPVFLRDHLFQAYEQVRVLAMQTITGLNSAWQRSAANIMRHASTSKTPEAISFKEAKKHLGKDVTDEELSNFFAFYEHAGLFACTNRADNLDGRIYSIPIIFQRMSANAFT